VTVDAIAFRERALAERLGSRRPTAEERHAWRSRGAAELLEDDDVLSVPMRLGTRVLGGMHVRPAARARRQIEFLEALARGVAEVVGRGALRATIVEAERESAVTAERGRIAADLHDTAGQNFVAIGLMARREAEHLPSDSPWRERFLRLAELADTGKWEIDRAVQALAFFPAARRGLASSLRSLARSFQSDSGIDALVEIKGQVARLSAQCERALYRVAHEALTNAWKHARCSTIRLELSFDDGRVALRVSDDGVGRGTAAQRARTRTGIASMRRAMSEVGGRLRISPVKPHGTVVEARIERAAQ
jgi:signal transduction histidine kinase